MVTLYNWTENVVADISNAQFLMESFPVACAGLPESLGPGEEATCTITEYVAPGFNVARWFGFGSGDGGWGFDAVS